MRYGLLLLMSLSLMACDMGTTKVVDPSKLPPLSAQERALLIAADAAANGGDMVSAERNYKSAMAQSKGHVEAHLALANVYMHQNQLDKAKEVLVLATEFQPNHVAANHLLGKIAIGENKPAEALNYFTAGLKTNPGHLDLSNGAGIANDTMHKHAAAQVVYLRALQLHPDEDLSMVKTNLAMSYLLDGKAQKAVDLLKKEVKKPGISPVMKHNLALAYGVLGRHTQAKTLLNGEISEEERLQSIKRINDYVAQELLKRRPAVPKPEKPPTATSKPLVKPTVHQE